MPDVSGLTKEFDYLVAADDVERLAVGSLVRVELNRRSIAGWVTAVGEPAPGGVELRLIDRITSAGPSPDLVDLARWAAHRWSGRVSSILKTASPPRQVKLLPPTDSAHDHDPGEGRVVVVRHGPTSDLVPLVTTLVPGRGSTLIVGPRVGLARRLAGELRRSGLATRVHPGDWVAAATRGGVILGARSAVWARVADLRAVIVIDEHDDGLQEERNPTWHARDVAIERARRAGIDCFLVSPSPSIAALAAADEVIEPARGAERAGWPVVELVDRRDDEPGRHGLFSARVADVVRGPGTVLAVLNRKGRAIMLACGSCGELVRTEDGERLMVERDGVLICPSSGETRPVVCANCGATKLKRLRLGVARAAEELSALVGEPVGEITAEDRGRRPARVVVGTEAALHQLLEADTVVFLDFDQELLAPRYRAAEQAMSLLILAARLVGGRSSGGRIVVQTRTPDHRVLHAAVRADPRRFAEAERAIRDPMGMPPFGAIAEVSGAGAEAFADLLIASADPDVTVLGPRQDGRYLVRADSPERLAEILATAERPSDRIRVAVDPPRA